MMWYMGGMNHLPYQEDFQDLPMVSGRFELCPSKFLDRDKLIRIQKQVAWASTLSESLIRYI